MSADHWATCPRCLDSAKSVASREREAVMALYGEVPPEEFDRRREGLREVDPEDYRTFREDYEFYGAEEGEVTASYSGSCKSCGLATGFLHVEHFYSRARTETPDA